MLAASLWLTVYCSVSAAAEIGSRHDPSRNERLVGWQAASSHRSTWDITSNCLTTVFACTWSVQHLNIPSLQRDDVWRRTWRSFKWMMITVLFPELIIIHAILEFQLALQSLRLLKENNKPIELPWWLKPPLSREIETNLESRRFRSPKWTLTHCYYGNMGGFYYEQRFGARRRFPITAHQLAEEEGYDIPVISKEEIEDKSKLDWFAKTVAALSILQLALSLIVRKAQGLAFSQLETLTLGLAVCGSVIYLLYIYKPQSVGTSTPLGERAEGGHLMFRRTYDSLWRILTNDSSNKVLKQRMGSGTVIRFPNSMPSEYMPDRIPNDNIPIFESWNAHPGLLLLAFASGAFGALHAIAWNFEFPSTVEKIFWQAATVVAAASPVVGLLAVPFAQWTISAGDPQVFAINCLSLMREYMFHTRDLSIYAVYEKLEHAIAHQDEPQRYADIFPIADDGLNLISKLYEFLHEPQFTQSPGHPDTQLRVRGDQTFNQQFDLLHHLLMGRGEIKKLVDTATTDLFPRKSLLPPAFNFGVLSVTGFLYCLARVALLAIGFSSLRQMPESVYVRTPWTAYIPTLAGA